MKRLVLVGAGHAHLHTIARTAGIVRRGFDVTLVSPGPFVYSSYIAATVGGRIAPEAGVIDTFAKVAAAGGRAIQGRVARVDAKARTLALADGTVVPWDVLSLDVGSRVPRAHLPGAADHALRVKPYDEMRVLDARLRERRGPVTVLIMGGGASAVELAGNLEWRLRPRGDGSTVGIATAGPRLLEEMPASASAKVTAHLKGRGVEVTTDWPVAGIEDGCVIDADGRTRPFDLLVDATGLEPADLAARSALPDHDGALLVDSYLRSLADVRILGGGDAIRMRGFEHVKPVGVHAVRQGPVLYHNLLATLEGRPLRTWGPPAKTYLAALDLGDGRAFAIRGRLHWLGRSARWLKDGLDARFIRRHR